VSGQQTPNGWYVRPSQRVDVRTWDGHLTDALRQWLGDTPHRQDGEDLLVRTDDPEPACARPGWVLLRTPDGNLIVLSTAAMSALGLEPAQDGEE
jgi:hypothetical protein